jgi:hypothetical protein
MECFFAVGSRVGREAPRTDEFSEAKSGAGLVLNNQDALGGRCRHYFLRPRSREEGGGWHMNRV